MFFKKTKFVHLQCIHFHFKTPTKYKCLHFFAQDGGSVKFDKNRLQRESPTLSKCRSQTKTVVRISDNYSETFQHAIAKISWQEPILVKLQ